MKKQNNAIIGIYKITNPKGKVYIGQSINIEKRWITYTQSSKHINQPKLRNSLLKYSPQLHKFEILEECLLEQLNEKETFYKKQFIEQHNWDKALFCELYDPGTGGYMSNETKQKISEALKGNSFRKNKPASEKTKQKISEALKGKPKSDQHKLNMKQPRSEEAKINISKGKKDKPSPMKGKTRSYKGRVSPMKGKKQSKESILKSSLSRLGKNKKGDYIKNTVTNEQWISKSQCAKHYNVSVTTINNWLKINKNNLISLEN